MILSKMKICSDIRLYLTSISLVTRIRLWSEDVGRFLYKDLWSCISCWDLECLYSERLIRTLQKLESLILMIVMILRIKSIKIWTLPSSSPSSFKIKEKGYRALTMTMASVKFFLISQNSWKLWSHTLS